MRIFDLAKERERQARLDALADRLRQCRERQGIAACVVSELCGLHPDSVRRYEQGETLPSAWSLCALADYYGVTVDWLLGRADR